MKPTIINHPLRVIKLEYNSDADLSEMEKKALEEYLFLHNDLFSLKERLAIMLQSLGKLEKSLYYLEEEKEILCEALKKCGPLAGYTDEECDGMGIEEGEINVNSIVSEALEHQKKMNENYNDTHALGGSLKVWQIDSEVFDERLDLFRSNYFSPIIQQWEQMEINIVSLDMDTQDFYGMCDQLFYRGDNDQFIKCWNKYIARYDYYMKTLKDVFGRVDKLGQMANDVIVQQRTGFRMN